MMWVLTEDCTGTGNDARSGQGTLLLLYIQHRAAYDTGDQLCVKAHEVFLVLRRGRVCVAEAPVGTNSDAGWGSALNMIVTLTLNDSCVLALFGAGGSASSWDDAPKMDAGSNPSSKVSASQLLRFSRMLELAAAPSALWRVNDASQDVRMVTLTSDNSGGVLSLDWLDWSDVC